jgi:tetratricopeptide (TPR) repeat protein
MTTAPSNAVVPKASLVGRILELKELDDALDRAVLRSNVEVVTLVGGAGIGKTRVVQEFVERVRTRVPKAHVHVVQCVDARTSTETVARVLKARFGIAESASPERAAELLREGIEATLGDGRVDEFFQFLGPYLGLRLPESSLLRAMQDDAVQFAGVARAVLRRFLELDALKSPSVLVFEDLHEASDDTLELVAHLTEVAKDAPMMFVAVGGAELLARKPEFGREDRPQRRVVELSPLSAAEAAALMTQLLAPLGEIPDELVDAAVDMAGGSPYLLEQMVRTYLAWGVLVDVAGKWEADLSRLEDVELPLTVEDAVDARIAALTPPERILLEKAATMGGVFWLGALVALGRIDQEPPELWGGVEQLAHRYREILAGLVQKEYVIELPDSGVPGDSEYAFSHNLERERLYSLASRAQMRRFHLVVAEWLEFHLAERAEEQCDLLAFHYERGGAERKAGQYYLLAGDRARARYANAKAIEYFTNGLRLIGEEDIVSRIDALHDLGDVLQLAGRNDEALAAFRSMLSIAFRLDLKAKGGAAHNRLGRLYRAIGHLEDAMRHLGTGHALFEVAGDQRGVASSLDDVGKVHWMRGSYDTAERFAKRALEIREELGDARSIALSYNNLGLVYQDSGRFSEALEAFENALSLRREINDWHGIAQTLNNIGSIHEDNEEHEEALRLWGEALDYAAGVGDRMRQAVILTNIGEAQYRLEQPSAAIDVLKQAEELSATLGDRILEGEILRGLAKAHLLARELVPARQYIERSMALFEQAKGKPFLGVALRTYGEIVAASAGGPVDVVRGRDAYLRSIALFEDLGNELELARSCEAYAAFLELAATHGGHDGSVAEGYRSRAAEIWNRLHKSEADLASPIEVDFGGLENS